MILIGNSPSKLWEAHFHTSLNKEIPTIVLVFCYCCCFVLIFANRNPISWSHKERHGLYFYVLRFNLSKSKMLLLVISTALWRLHLDLTVHQDNTTYFSPEGIWYFFLEPHFLCYSDSYICLQLGLRPTHCCHISKESPLRLKTQM